MATIKQPDVIKRSWLLQSAHDKLRNRAVRGLDVIGLPGTSFQGDLAAANTYLLGNLPAAHPQDSSLPLIDVRSRNLKLGQTRSVALYAHTRYTNPTADPFLLVRKRLVEFDYERVALLRDPDASSSSDSIEGVTIIPHIELAEGTFDMDQFLALSSRKVPVFQYLVRAGLLGEDPQDDLKNLVNKYNSDTVCFNGKPCAPYTLKFIGPAGDIEPVHTAAGIKYHAHYVFHHKESTWATARVFLDTLYFGGTGKGHIIKVPPDDNALPFADAFALFDESTGPTECGDSSASAL